MTTPRTEAPVLSRQLTRRRFLRTSASALAAPYVIPSSALGLAGAVAPSERITIGQLGLIACRVGKTLRWDPDKEQFTNSDEANRLLRRPDGRAPWNVWA